MKCQGKRRSWDGRTRDTGSCSSGDGESAPSPGGGPGGKSFFPFLGCSPKLSEQFPMSPVPKGARTAVHGTQSPHSRPPLLSPVGSRVRFEDAMPSPVPPAHPWSQVSVAPRTQTLLRNALPSESGPCAPLRCPTAGTSVASLVPLVRSLASAPQAVSLAHENHQTWLRDSVRPASSQVQGRSVHLCVEQGCPSLACGSRGPAGEGRDRAGSSSRDEVGVLQPVLHRTQERRWVTTNLGPARPEPGPSQAPVQDADAETHFSMHPSVRLVRSDRPEGRVLSCLDPPSTQTVSPLCVRRASISVQSPPLRAIPVASCLHQGRGGSPCSIKGSRHSRSQLPRRLAHVGPVSSTVVRTRLGLRVNWEKSKLSPVQRISFLGMELDSVNLTARLSVERAQSMLNCLESFQRKRAVPLKHFQRLLGHMASAAAVTPLGLLHMRPLQHWLHDRVPRWAWRRGTYRVSVTPSCRQTFGPWSDLAFLRAGVPLGQVSRHVVVSTDASAMGWGAMCNGHAAAGLWTGSRLQWHINCLELLAVWLALRRFKGLLHDKHVLVRTDNTATVAYINHQGGLRSRRLSQLARHLLLWSQKHLRSFRAVHIPGELNRAADELSRQPALPGEWRLHPEVVQLIWRRFGDAQVDLFASPDTFHCQLFYSLSEGTLGTDALAHSWPRGLRKYAFPPVSLLAQILCKVREDEEQVLLVAPYWPNRTWFPELMLLATAPPWQIPLRRDLLSQRGGTLWHPRPDLWNLHVWSLDGTRRF